jgi:hypothetical protein
MHRVGLGIFVLLLSCGLLQAESGKRFVVGCHAGMVVPSLDRIEDLASLDDWRYDLGWGVDVNFSAIERINITALYDIYPIRYSGLLDRTDIKDASSSGRIGLLHHASGEILYNYFVFDSSRSQVFVGGSVDYFHADHTVTGTYMENNTEVSFSNTASINKFAFGVPVGLHSMVGSKLNFSFQIKPILYYWNDRNQLQFITTMATIYLGYAF